MLAENREHRTLRVGGEVEEAVPGDDRTEALAQREAARVAGHPGHGREARFAQVDHGRSRIDAGHAAVIVDEVACDRLAGPAAEIQHRAVARWQAPQNRVEVSSLHQLAAAVAIEGGRVRLVDVNDFRHAALLSAAYRR